MQTVGGTLCGARFSPSWRLMSLSIASHCNQPCVRRCSTSRTTVLREQTAALRRILREVNSKHINSSFKIVPPPSGPKQGAVKLFAGGVIVAVVLGSSTSWVAYKYLDTSRQAVSIDDTPSELPTWPLFVAAGGAFGAGGAGGMAYGLSKRSTDEAKNKIAREGVLLGAKAFGIATALVGLGGILVVAGLRFGLGLHSIREFGELVRGGPLIYSEETNSETPWGSMDASSNDSIPRYNTQGATQRLPGGSGLDVAYDLLGYCGTEAVLDKAVLRKLSWQETSEDRTSQAIDSKHALSECRVVLLLHGLGQNVSRTSVVETVAPTLVEAGYAVLAPDQRGIGDSTTWKQRARWWRFQPGTGQPDDADIQPLTVSNLAKDMTSLLDELGVQWLLSRVCLLLPSPCCIWQVWVKSTSSALELVHSLQRKLPEVSLGVLRRCICRLA